MTEHILRISQSSFFLIRTAVLKSFMNERLSFICATELIPLSTVITPSRLAAKRIAHDAGEGNQVLFS